MTDKLLESRVYVHCRIVDPKDEESFLELDPVSSAPKKGHRAKTLIPRSAFFASANPYDLVGCVRGSYVNNAEAQEVTHELDRFDRLALETPPVFCEFPQSDWEIPDGTRVIALPERPRETPYKAMMAVVTKHMLDFGRAASEQLATADVRREWVRSSPQYHLHRKFLEREMVELERLRYAPALFAGVRVVLDDARVSERVLRKYVDLLCDMYEHKQAPFLVAKRSLLKDIL